MCIAGTVLDAIRCFGQLWVAVGFGDSNALLIFPYPTRIMEPSTRAGIGLDPPAFQIIALKSRAHFRRGFDDSGFAKTILLFEPMELFLRTVRLDALRCENVELDKYYPCVHMSA